MALDQALRARIQALIEGDPVVLFMKGNRAQPRCGFSATVVQILDGLLPTYRTVDVLGDADIRDGIKELSEWPTIPQLYVKGEFLGGCDTTKEMFASGELQTMLAAVGDAPSSGTSSAPASTTAPESATPPVVRVTLTPAAAQALASARAAESGERQFLRLGVNGRFKHQLSFGPRLAGDSQCESEGITILVDQASAPRADGVQIDFVQAPQAGFKIVNPNEPVQVGQLNVAELKAKLDAGEAIQLFDVRTPAERDQAKIAGARHLDDEARAFLEGLDKQTPLYFHCHHGGRSQAAAEHYLQKGHRSVFNIVGGIDAWARDVDTTVPRY